MLLKLKQIAFYIICLISKKFYFSKLKSQNNNSESEYINSIDKYLKQKRYLVAGKILVSVYDIYLGFLAGFFQLGFGFILITIGARRTPSALVGIIMLTEAVLGPFWAWLFINEQPPLTVLIGGSVVIIAVLLQFLPLLKKNKASLQT